MPDFKWMSCGGCLVDGGGDLAFASPDESLQDMINTRLKAAFDGWQLYRIGADLDALIGNTVDAEAELAIRRQVEAALTQDFLPRGSFQVKTLPIGSLIQVYVYLADTLMATVQVTV
jgi:hypothetical protein